MTVSEKAYAKINWYLSVGDCRPDGYHELTTVMQTVGLYDVLTVTMTPSPRPSVSLSLPGNGSLPTDRKNLAYLAAERYLDVSGLSYAVSIELQKRIPVAAGMAGGSSDAAAVLRALNRTLGALKEDSLHSLAAELGSDVPFCLVGGCAVCRGRGERITPVVGVPPRHLVLALSGEPVSTPEAFRLLDQMPPRPVAADAELSALVDALKRGAPLGTLYNSFESVILPTLPVASELHERLSVAADATLMSGSGSSIFGVFADENAARATASALVDDGYCAIAVSTV